MISDDDFDNNIHKMEAYKMEKCGKLDENRHVKLDMIGSW